MTFNLTNTHNEPRTFSEVGIGEGFFSALSGYYIKIAYDRAVRVGLTKDQPSDDKKGTVYEDSFCFDDPVDEIYRNVSVTME